MPHERAPHPRIRAAGAHGILDAVAAAGGSPDRVLAAAGLRASDLSDPDRFLELTKVATLFAEAAKETGDDGFGLHVGCASDLGALGALSYAVLHAATLGTALHNLERYVHSHLQGARVALETEADECRLVFDFPIAGVEGRHGVESAMALVLQILRRLVGPDWTPRRVLFSHPRPASTALHQRIFGAPVAFGAAVDGALVFDAADEAFEVLARGHCIETDQVLLLDFVAGMGQEVGEVAVVREDHQALALDIEAADGMELDITDGDEVEHSFAALVVVVVGGLVARRVGHGG